jgi:hypothetical protein
MVTKEYKAPSVHHYGSMTKLTNWDNEKMVCSDATYYSGTTAQRNAGLAILPPGVGPDDHSGWNDYAADNDCDIFLGFPLP